MATGLIDIMKRASMDAVENAQLTDIRYGTVTGVSPLKVQVTNQLIIPESLLVVPQHLTNYSINVTVNWTTENNSATESSITPHNHDITGTKSISINNALKIGEKVALLKQAGGRSYFILDKI